MNARADYKSAARAYRAEAGKRQANEFYWAVVAPTRVERPVGFSEPATDPLTRLSSRRAALLSSLRETRAVLEKRAEEHRIDELIGTVGVVTHIVTDECLAARITNAVYLHRCHVRGALYPLFQLHMAESGIQTLAAYRALCLAETNALYGAAERVLGVAA